MSLYLVVVRSISTRVCIHCFCTLFVTKLQFHMRSEMKNRIKNQDNLAPKTISAWLAQHAACHHVTGLSYQVKSWFCERDTFCYLCFTADYGGHKRRTRKRNAAIISAITVAELEYAALNINVSNPAALVLARSLGKVVIG